MTTRTANATPVAVLPATHRPKPTTAPVRDERICRYLSKRCANPRAIKRGGLLHSYCEFHRSIANRNQRRSDMRKRLKKVEGKATVASGKPAATEAELRINAEPKVPTKTPLLAIEPTDGPTELNAEDLYILRILFEVPESATYLQPPPHQATSIAPKPLLPLAPQPLAMHMPGYDRNVVFCPPVFL